MVLTQKNRTCKRCENDIPKEKAGSTHCPKCLKELYEKMDMEFDEEWDKDDNGNWQRLN